MVEHLERLADTLDIGRIGSDPSSHGAVQKVAACAGTLLRENPNQVFNFYLKEELHSVSAPGQKSFKALTSAWKGAGNCVESDRDNFPEVLNSKANSAWTECTLRCTCGACREGKAVELECEPYRFGERKGQTYEVRMPCRLNVKEAMH
jgi:hypothetical protein